MEEYSDYHNNPIRTGWYAPVNFFGKMNHEAVAYFNIPEITNDKLVRGLAEEDLRPTLGFRFGTKLKEPIRPKDTKKYVPVDPIDINQKTSSTELRESLDGLLLRI